MLCEFERVEGENYRCGRCETTIVTRQLPIFRHCGEYPPPPKLPGTELWIVLGQLGFDGEVNCQCASYAWQMNLWGAVGCREHFEEIVGWLRESYDRLGWAEKLKAAAKSVASGLALSIDPRDPPRSLVELAIRRAEINAS